MRYSGWAQERWKGRRLVREMERFTNHLTRKQTARKRNNNSLMNCRRPKVDVRRKRRFTPAFHRVRHHESERARQQISQKEIIKRKFSKKPWIYDGNFG